MIPISLLKSIANERVLLVSTKVIKFWEIFFKTHAHLAGCAEAHTNFSSKNNIEMIIITLLKSIANERVLLVSTKVIKFWEIFFKTHAHLAGCAEAHTNFSCKNNIEMIIIALSSRFANVYMYIYIHLCRVLISIKVISNSLTSTYARSHFFEMH